MPDHGQDSGGPPVVLLDANVLMSRVQRDYFLYASAEGVIDVKWSPGILEEMNRNLVANRGVSQQGADRLQDLLGRHFADAEVEPGPDHFAAFDRAAMPDPDDRHVLAAAVASNASVLCTNNVKDFPDQAMTQVGIDRRPPDEVLDRLIVDHPEAMARVHQTTVERNPRATSESTLDALRRSGAPQAADRMEQVINARDTRGHTDQRGADQRAHEEQRLAGLGFAQPAAQITGKSSAPAQARVAPTRRPGSQPGQQR